MLFSNSTLSRSRGAVLSALGAVSLTLFTAQATASEPQVEKLVRFADLDLAKEQDAAELYARMGRAVRVVCRTYESRELQRREVWDACADRALSEAVATVDNAMLKALHETQTRARLARGRNVSEPAG